MVSELDHSHSFDLSSFASQTMFMNYDHVEGKRGNVMDKSLDGEN